MKKMIAAVFAVVVSFAAYAEENPLQFDPAYTALTPSVQAYLQTLAMPKGWFSSKNSLDKLKTNLATSITSPATGCKPAIDFVINSSTTGRFDSPQVLNPQSKVVGYIWDYYTDLGGFQNEWHYHTYCDNSQSVDGCQETRTVVATIKAYGPDGCKTYTDAAGFGRCAGDTVSFDLPAVQVATVEETNCAPIVNCDIGIGQCVNDLERACNEQFPEHNVTTTTVDKNGHTKSDTTDTNAGARAACKHAAVCECKNTLLPLSCDQRCD